MKFIKYLSIVLLVIALIFTTFLVYNSQKNNNNTTLSTENNIETKKELNNNTKDENITENSNKNSEEVTDYSVSKNGWLCVNSTEIQNEKGQNIQLKGLSSHGIQWFPEVLTYNNLKQLKEDWKINVFRIAMYSDAYVANPDSIKQKLINTVNDCINLDMYVIIDWHILADNNPNTYYEQANKFFEEISSMYSNNPNVIYEICNEPNGNNVTWNNEVKPYAEKIIPTIRKNSSKSLIIVGTPDWCKQLKPVADNPLEFKNIAYSCHFYSGSHGKELQYNIDYALNKNICILVSECGLTDASGNGKRYFNEFDSWINYLNSKNISWIFWSFANKDESSSILLPNFPINNNENNINNYLSETGKYIKEKLQTK